MLPIPPPCFAFPPKRSERSLAHKTVVIAHAVHFSVTRGQSPSLSVDMYKNSTRGNR